MIKYKYISSYTVSPPTPQEDPGREGSTPYNGLYGDAPPERGTLLRLEVYKRIGISRAEVQKRVGKPVI